MSTSQMMDLKFWEMLTHLKIEEPTMKEQTPIWEKLNTNKQKQIMR